MTPEYRLAQIIETIRAIQFGKPVTIGRRDPTAGTMA
jgi:hypothetical protein